MLSPELYPTLSLPADSFPSPDVWGNAEANAAISLPTILVCDTYSDSRKRRQRNGAETFDQTKDID